MSIIKRTEKLNTEVANLTILPTETETIVLEATEEERLPSTLEEKEKVAAAEDPAVETPVSDEPEITKETTTYEHTGVDTATRLSGLSSGSYTSPLQLGGELPGLDGLPFLEPNLNFPTRETELLKYMGEPPLIAAQQSPISFSPIELDNESIIAVNDEGTITLFNGRDELEGNVLENDISIHKLTIRSAGATHDDLLPVGDQPVVINGEFGRLRLWDDGDFNYDVRQAAIEEYLNSFPPGQQPTNNQTLRVIDTFHYTAEDSSGDVSNTANMTFNILFNGLHRPPDPPDDVVVL